VLVVLGTATVGSSVWYVHDAASGRVYSAQDVPPAPVALVLGALVEPDGVPSDFLVARLALAQRLYDTGKVHELLVSGDRRPGYDEPDTMHDWLVAHGVPADRIMVDGGGVDTYQSCLRAGRVFGVHQVIVVSQTYHLDRSVTLCRHLGVDATAVGDDSVRGRDRFSWWRATVREWGADVKAVARLIAG
jgi:vancomycin permeability regulator SanA